MQTQPTFEQMKQALIERYKHERLYGDPADYGRGVVYGDRVVHAHLNDLIKHGYDCISKYESRTGKAVYLRVVDGAFEEVQGEAAISALLRRVMV